VYRDIVQVPVVRSPPVLPHGFSVSALVCGEAVPTALVEDRLQQQSTGRVLRQLGVLGVGGDLQVAATAIRQVVFEGDHPVVEVEDAEPEPTVLLRHLGQSPIEALPARALANGISLLAFPT